jgi:hypothetical protein
MIEFLQILAQVGLALLLGVVLAVLLGGRWR